MCSIPDYEKMRDMLAESELENMDQSTMYDIIRYGNFNSSWDTIKDEEVLESFVDFFGTHKIPKMSLPHDKGREEAMERYTKRLEDKSKALDKKE